MQTKKKKLLKDIKKSAVKFKKNWKKTSYKEKLVSVRYFAIKSSWKQRIIILSVIAVLVFGVRYFITNSKKEEVTYETSTVERGTLISSISGSGTITSGNYNNINTKASGTVSNVYVTNGDKVTKGQKIADVTLDDYAKERQTAAWVSYLEAKEDYLEALNQKSLADISMWNSRQDVLDAQEALDNMNDNDTNPATNESYTDGERMIITKTLDQSRLAFDVAEAKYNNSDADISYASARVTAALRDYQENSASIVAPSAGVVSDLSLAKGLVVNASSTTSSTSGATIVSAQTVGKINDTEGQLIATIELTEIDIINVKANQKVTIALDAYEDKTFTGKVLAVNTSGSVSSGVTSYPVTILLDPTDIEIYPNMAVSTEIITNIKTDVLTVPTTAVQTDNGQSYVQVMKNGSVEYISVEVGISNDTSTEILSGLNEGDEVITSIITSSTSTTSTDGSTSPFSGIGRSSSTRSSGGGIPMGGPGF